MGVFLLESLVCLGLFCENMYFMGGWALQSCLWTSPSAPTLPWKKSIKAILPDWLSHYAVRGRGYFSPVLFQCEISPWSSVFSEGLVSFGCKKHCQSSKVRRISVVVENSVAHTPAYKVCPYRKEKPDPMKAAGICYEIWGYLDKFLQWFTLSRVQDHVFWKNVKYFEDHIVFCCTINFGYHLGSATNFWVFAKASVNMKCNCQII